MICVKLEKTLKYLIAQETLWYENLGAVFM